jgi:hypothetical protein
MPEIAMKEVISWLVMAFIGLGMAGFSTAAGAYFFKKVFYKNGNDRRGANGDMFTDLMRIHKESIEMNQEMLGELRATTRGMNNLKEDLDRKAERAFDDHRELMSAVKALSRV